MSKLFYFAQACSTVVLDWTKRVEQLSEPIEHLNKKDGHGLFYVMSKIQNLSAVALLLRCRDSDQPTPIDASIIRVVLMRSCS